MTRLKRPDLIAAARKVCSEGNGCQIRPDLSTKVLATYHLEGEGSLKRRGCGHVVVAELGSLFSADLVIADLFGVGLAKLDGA